MAAIKLRAMAGLQTIEKAINDHPTTGGAKRLVRFLADLHNGEDYPFDLSELRGLDTALANACLDYFQLRSAGDQRGLQASAIAICTAGSKIMAWSPCALPLIVPRQLSS